MHKTCHCSRTGRRVQHPSEAHASIRSTWRLSQEPWEHISETRQGGLNPAVVPGDVGGAVLTALLLLPPRVADSPRAGEAKERERFVQDRPQSGRLGETPTGQRREAPLSSLAGWGGSSKRQTASHTLLISSVRRSPLSQLLPRPPEAKVLHQPSSASPCGRITRAPRPT